MADHHDHQAHSEHADGAQNAGGPDWVLMELADRQHGVVARRQVEDRGVTRAMLERRVARGQLVRVHRGVYAVGHRRLRREGWWMAAVLAAGRGALLSHRDAAALHGLLAPGDHRRVEVTTAGRAASTPAIRVRQARLAGEDAARRDGIPVTGVGRTLVDLAGTVARQRLAKAVEEAARLGRLDAAEVERALGRTAGRRGDGHRAMRAALAARERARLQLTRSELEDRFLALLDARGLPRPLANRSVDGVEVDACWPQRRVIVELDGWARHGTPEAFQRDRERANALTTAGWTVLRFTHGDVARAPARTAAVVAHALARARRYPPTP